MDAFDGHDFFAENIMKEDEMLQEEMYPSEIQQFYQGTTILLTGFTGFIGKILLEKLLRSCHGLKKIYLLLRAKKGKSIETRLKEELKDPLFETLLRTHPQAMDKVILVYSDLTNDEIVSPEDRKKLVQEVNIIFHCAATVRFDEKLRQAVSINIKSTRYLIMMAREMPNLKAFVHVSTAYANCMMREIPESVVPLKYNYKEIVGLVELLNDDVLEKITPIIIENWENTYVFTKAIGECMVKENSKGLPIGIFRPSIVISTAHEPLSGWINNYYGPQGVVFGAGIGLLRVLHCRPDVIADMVPVDYVCNALIVFAWDIAQTRGDNPNFERLTWKGTANKESTDNESEKNDMMDDVPIINFVSSNKVPITWSEFMAKNFKMRHENYSKLQLWHSSLTLTGNTFHYNFKKVFCHLLPAAIVDTIARIIGKKPCLLDAYKKIHKFSKTISYFCLNQWKFEEKNVTIMWNKLSKRDKQIFYFDMTKFDWSLYLANYLKGLRVYLGKDDMSTLPEGRRKAVRLMIAHYTLITFLYLLGFYILWWIFSRIF